MAHTAVQIVQDHTLRGRVVLDDDDAAGVQRPTFRGAETQPGADPSGGLSLLHPDHVIGVGLGTEVLQPTTEVVPHLLALFTQVGLGFGQKALCHVHHVHHPEEQQKQSLGGPSNGSATVQSTGSHHLVRAFY